MQDTAENKVAVLNIELPKNSEYIWKRIKSRVSKKYLYAHIQSIIIYNSHKVEVIQVFIDR